MMDPAWIRVSLLVEVGGRLDPLTNSPSEQGGAFQEKKNAGDKKIMAIK